MTSAAVAAFLARILEAAPPPGLPAEAATAAVVLAAVLLRPTWRVLRHGVTLVHEAGHGAAATAAGRRLTGIRLHSDTSGLTVSVGRARGPGMAFTLLAGYPAPCAAGVAAAAGIAAGHATAVLWGAIVLLALVLLQIRNGFGLWSVVVCGAAVVAATLLLDAAWRGVAATGIALLLATGGLRAALELPAARRGGERGSDADQLADVTHLPAVLWVGCFWLCGLAGAAATVWLLLPPSRP